MSELNSVSKSTYQALKFLEQNSSFLQSLLLNCDRNVEQITAIMEPILRAPKRCELAPYYIQAVNTEKNTFLVTNLSQPQAVKVVDSSSTWSIGRKSTCSISIANLCISRQHAVIGHELGRNFYIMDIGSRNGTKLNHSQLNNSDRYALSDGDLIELGSIQVEFFVAICQGQDLSKLAKQVSNADLI